MIIKHTKEYQYCPALKNRTYVMGIIFCLISALIFNACEKENTDVMSYPVTYEFKKSEMIGSIEMFDSSMNRIDKPLLASNYCTGFNQNDFLFDDDDVLPYDKITIYEDSSVTYQTTIKQLPYLDAGLVMRRNDTLCFYIPYYTSGFMSTAQGPAFKAIDNKHHIIIKAYGYKNIDLSYGSCSWSGDNSLGEPDYEYIYRHSVGSYGYIFVQQFNLIYKKVLNN